MKNSFSDAQILGAYELAPPERAEIEFLSRVERGF